MRLTTFVALSVVPFGVGLAQEAWHDPSPHTEGIVIANGVRLHYLDWGGHGPTLVFLTGLGVTPHLFDRLAPHFTDQYRVLGLTRRGLGKSERTKTGYDTGTLTEDVRGFLDAMHVDRATFVGWSLGGTEMTRLAERYPSRVDRLVYLEAAYDWAPFPVLWNQDPVGSGPTVADLASFEASKRWFVRTQGMWSDAVEADGRAVNLLPNGRMTMDVMPPEIMRQLVAGMALARPNFGAVRAPALAFYAVSLTHPALSPDTPDGVRRKGETYWRDRFLPAQRKQIDAFKAARPDARVVELTDGRHLCFIRPQDEERVLREMRAFLAEETR